MRLCVCVYSSTATASWYCRMKLEMVWITRQYLCLTSKDGVRTWQVVKCTLYADYEQEARRHLTNGTVELAIAGGIPVFSERCKKRVVEHLSSKSHADISDLLKRTQHSSM